MTHIITGVFRTRATAEAAELSATGHAVARRAGGRVSPEMQTPKLMWLARHRPDAWAGRPPTDHWGLGEESRT